MRERGRERETDRDQWLRALAALPEDPGSFPAPTGQHKANSSSTLSSRPAWSTELVPEQVGLLHRENLWPKPKEPKDLVGQGWHMPLILAHKC